MSSSLIESVAFWSGVVTVVATAVAALAGSLSWYFSDKASSAKDEALSRFKIDSKLEIAKTYEAADVARNSAAIANQKAASLEKEAAEAKLETARLEAAMQSRQINAAVPIESLRPFAGTRVRLQYLREFEPARLAGGLMQALKAAGWNVEIVSDISRGESPWGFSEGIQIVTREVDMRQPDSKQREVIEAADALAAYMKDAIHPKIKGRIGSSLSIERLNIIGDKVGMREGDINVAIGPNPGPLTLKARRWRKEAYESLPEEIKKEMGPPPSGWWE